MDNEVTHASELLKTNSIKKRSYIKKLKEKDILNNISIFEVIQYLNSNNYEETFEWIIKNVKTRCTNFTKKFSSQFDGFKELIKFIENLPQSSKPKWYNIIRKQKYALPYSVRGWPLLFGQFVPSLCLQANVNFSFLRERCASKKQIQSKSENLEIELSKSSTNFKNKIADSSAPVGLVKCISDYKIKYVRALRRAKANGYYLNSKFGEIIKLKENKIKKLEVKNQELNRKIQVYMRKYAKVEKELNNLESSKSVAKDIKRKPRKSKAKEHKKFSSKYIIAKVSKSSRMVDKYSENSQLVLCTEKNISSKLTTKTHKPSKDKKCTFSNNQAVPALQKSSIIGNERSQDCKIFADDSSQSFKELDIKKCDALPVCENSSKKITEQAVLSNMLTDVSFDEFKSSDKQITDIGSDLLLNYNICQSDKNRVSSKLHLITGYKEINCFRTVRKGLKQLKILCSKPQLNPKEVGITIRHCDESFRFLESVVNETEFKLHQFKREVQVLQTDLNISEHALNSSLNEKDVIKKKYSELKRKLSSSNSNSTSKIEVQDKMLEYNKNINVCKTDVRSNVMLLKSNKQCSKLKEELQSLKTCVKDEMSSFNIYVGGLKTAQKQYDAQLEAKEKECFSLKKFITDTKETLGLSSNNRENEITPFNNEWEIDQIRTYHDINRKNFEKCSRLLNSLQQQVKKFGRRNLQHVKEKKVLRNWLMNLSKNMRKLQSDIKVSKTSLKSVNSGVYNNNCCDIVSNVAQTAQNFESKNKHLESKLNEYKTLTNSYSKENLSLKSRCEELKAFLKQEQCESSRQLELQLAMFCSTSERYREQIKRMENTL